MKNYIYSNLERVKQLLNNNKIDEAGILFNKILGHIEQDSKLTNLLSSLYDIDKSLEDSSRNKFFSLIAENNINRLPEAESTYLKEMRGYILHDKYRLKTIEKLELKFPLNASVRFCYAKAMAEEASQSNHLDNLKKAFALHNIEDVDSNHYITVDRANILMFLIQELCNQNFYDEAKTLISASCKTNWLQKSQLAAHFVTMGANLKIAKSLQNNAETTHAENLNVIRTEINDQKFKFLEVIGVFVALITIVGVSFQNAQSEASFKVKAYFLILTTLSMLFFLTSIILLSKHDRKKTRNEYVVLTLTICMIGLLIYHWNIQVL